MCVCVCVWRGNARYDGCRSSLFWTDAMNHDASGGPLRVRRRAQALALIPLSWWSVWITAEGNVWCMRVCFWLLRDTKNHSRRMPKASITSCLMCRVWAPHVAGQQQDKYDFVSHWWQVYGVLPSRRVCPAPPHKHFYKNHTHAAAIIQGDERTVAGGGGQQCCLFSPPCDRIH